ncbi:MAG: hypothetical protein Q8O72_10510 [Bacteroidales bacterium]|nr:hypothetical protein [Bacteroidales bacterium]
MTKKEENILNRFGNFLLQNNCSIDFLVELIELELDILNADTIPNFAKKKGKSYQGIIKTKQIKVIRGVRFVIDPD